MADEKKVGYVFQLSHQVGQDKTLSVSGNFAIGATTAEMVSEMDKVLDAFEIQNTKRMKLPTLAGELRDQKEALEKCKRELEQLLGSEKNLNSAQKQTEAQLRSRIQFLQDEAIPRGEEIVEALLAKVNMGE